jgi:hypothetical protein
MAPDYLTSVRKQFEYYKLLGDKTFAQLPDEALFWHYNAESNSIAVIVQHLWGNMLSRWTDFLTSDGEKPWRNRDAEFEPQIQTRQELLTKWEAGWACLLAALDSITEANQATTVYIRNQGHSITEALNRQLAHYPYHVGQIVFIGKLVLDGHWQSLSIPRGSSQGYNAEKFAQPRRRMHFTDEYLPGPKPAGS